MFFGIDILKNISKRLFLRKSRAGLYAFLNFPKVFTKLLASLSFQVVFFFIIYLIRDN